MPEPRDYEIAVVGGGVAGLTAALTAARHGRRTIVLMQLMSGGQLGTINRIEDFPGFPEGVAGYDLGPMIQEQAVAAGAECRTAEVSAIGADASGFSITTDQGPLTADAIILASGSTIRALDIPGEASLTGKGVSHCASCDGPMLRGRSAVVVGAGDAGMQEALALAEFAGQVTIIEREARPHAQAAYAARVHANDRITVECGSTVTAILGADAVTGVQVRDAAGNVSERAAHAVFVYAGLVPNSALAGGLVTLDATGHVPVDLRMCTAHPGLFAAGDVRAGSAGQAITAAGDGATAAISAHRYLAARATE